MLVNNSTFTSLAGQSIPILFFLSWITFPVYRETVSACSFAGESIKEYSLEVQYEK